MTDTQKKSQVAALTDIMLALDGDEWRHLDNLTALELASVMVARAESLENDTRRLAFNINSALEARTDAAVLGAMTIRYLMRFGNNNSRAADNRVSAPGAAQEDGGARSVPDLTTVRGGCADPDRGRRESVAAPSRITGGKNA